MEKSDKTEKTKRAGGRHVTAGSSKGSTPLEKPEKTEKTKRARRRPRGKTINYKQKTRKNEKTTSRPRTIGETTKKHKLQIDDNPSPRNSGRHQTDYQKLLTKPPTRMKTSYTTNGDQETSRPSSYVTTRSSHRHTITSHTSQ